MSQVTCCPNCSTSFRVTDAQLAAHQGKVRCGRCAFVFHAPDFLQTLTYEVENVETSVLDFNKGIESQSLATKAQPAIPPHDAHIDLSNKAKVVQTTEALAVNVEADTQITSALASTPKSSAKHAPESVAEPADESIAESVFAYVEARPDPVAALLESRPAKSTAHDHPQIEIDSDSEYQPILSDDDDLFQTPSATRSRWAGAWAFGAVLLIIVLLLQLTYVFRLQLAQDFPALRPKFLALCQTLKCEMPLPRQAQLLRSEYSELTFIPDNPKLIQLNATVRNLAAFEQELPQLELTLTDENEQIVVRKIFTAKQYLRQSPQHSIEANEEIHAFLQLDLGELHSTGYSLYWFY